MNHLDLFSGIGGFSLGLKQAGFDIQGHYFSEVDKHAIAIYQNQNKEAQYVGSVTDVRGVDLPKIDIITFGSPCQDFSLAGKRQGLEGQRSSLIGEAIRLIRECKPDFFIWENVKGAYSSNDGADYWAIIQAFADLDGYRLEQQLLNTAWFLPQNRERIYLVGRIADKCSGEIFPIEEASEVRDRRNQAEKEVHANNRTAITQCARQYASWGGDFIKVGTWRDFQKDGEIEGFREIKDGNCPTIPARAREDGSGQPVIKNRERIRRLTEIECERLQGFKDNHTEYGNYDGEVKPVSATQRYKCLGNAVTVDVVKVIGERILNAS